MNFNHIFVRILAGIFALLLASCRVQQTNFGQAPDFERPAVDGAQISLDDYVGKQPVLLYFHMAVG